MLKNKINDIIHQLCFSLRRWKRSLTQITLTHLVIIGTHLRRIYSLCESLHSKWIRACKELSTGLSLYTKLMWLSGCWWLFFVCVLYFAHSSHMYFADHIGLIYYMMLYGIYVDIYNSFRSQQATIRKLSWGQATKNEYYFAGEQSTA